MPTASELHPGTDKPYQPTMPKAHTSSFDPDVELLTVTVETRKRT